MSFKSCLAYIVTKFVQLNDTANAWNEFRREAQEKYNAHIHVYTKATVEDDG